MLVPILMTALAAGLALVPMATVILRPVVIDMLNMFIV